MEQLTLDDSRFSDKQKRIIRLSQEHPDESQAWIGKIVGSSKSYVQKTLAAWQEFPSQ